MAYAESYIHSRIEKLMGISTTLADLTQSVELAHGIPTYLSRALNAEPITLAVVRHDSRSPEIVLLASAIATAGNAAFANHVLEIHRQTRPPADAQISPLRSPFAVAASQPSKAASYEMAIPALTEYPRAVVFTHSIDERHAMFLVLHLSQESAAASAPSTARLDDLSLIADHLAKLLRCIPAWHQRPEVLGNNFQRLTDREWVVLQGLHSEDGEKQLADRLGLSPHTLHSHIKAIYRKVGVQGRLPLLLRMNAAVRDLRQTAINASAGRPERKAFPAPSEDAAIAVG